MEAALATRWPRVPQRAGNIENHQNILNRGFFPAQVAAGIVTKDGKAKYTGLHALRHFYASWCINRKQDGGLELPLKNVQERLGHATLALTSDRYGHLFKRGDDGSAMTGPSWRRPSGRCSADATQTRHKATFCNYINVNVRFCKPLVGSSILSPGTN
jgi:hypothetical protein